MFEHSAHPLDISIFAIFLVVNLVIGLAYSGRSKTMRDYAIGTKNFTTSTLTATIVATWITGSFFIATVEQAYLKGLYFIIPSTLGGAIGVLLTGVVGKYMGKFLNNLSIADAMGTMYGNRVKIITACSSIGNLIGWLAVQFQVLSKVLLLIFGVKGPGITILIAAIVVFYASLGGIKAVTFTDVVQFITFGTLVPIIALLVWRGVPSANELVQITLTTVPHFKFSEVFSLTPEFLSCLGWSLCWSIPAIAPEVFQRIAMANSTTQVRTSFIAAAGIILGLELLLVWIAILLLSSNATLTQNEIIPYLLDTYAYTGFKGLLGVGIIAMAMSSADSFLNSASVISVNDVLTFLIPTSYNRVTIVRLATVVIGCLSTALALCTEDLFKMILFSCSLYLPVVTVPFLLSVSGFRSSARSILIGMCLGMLTVILWSIWGENSDSMVPGMIANLVGIMGSHYLFNAQRRAHTTTLDNAMAFERAVRQQTRQRRIKSLRNFSFLTYLKSNLPISDNTYFFFGLYTIVTTYVSLYTLQIPTHGVHAAIYTAMYYATLPITTLFLTLPILPLRLKKGRLVAYLWPFGVGFMLFFSGALLVYLSQYHHLQMMILMINLLMSVLLLHWPLVLCLAVIGVSSATYLFFTYTVVPPPLLHGYAYSQFAVLYILLLFTSLIIIFLRGQQAYRRLYFSYERLTLEKTTAHEELLHAIYRQKHFMEEAAIGREEAVNAIKQMHSQINDDLQKAKTRGQLLAVNKKFHTILDKVDVLADYFNHIVSHQTQHHMHLKVSEVVLAELLDDVLTSYNAQEEAHKYPVLVQQRTACTRIHVDVKRIKQLLVDSLCYAQQHSKDAESLLLCIEDTLLGYPINSIPDHIKEVSALRFSIVTTPKKVPKLHTLYMVSVDQSITYLPKDVTELPIMHNQQIIEAHYGAFEFTKHTQGITQLYIIPIHLREVRPRAMDLLQYPPQVDIVDSTTDPTEQTLLQRVEEYGRIDITLVKKALNLIRQYHAGMTRKSGEAFYLHPIAVANILLTYTQDQDTILAALLHDTVEDTKLSLLQIALYFNTSVKDIVDGVTRLASNLNSLRGIRLSKHENILQLLSVKDRRVLHVKLADRLHNIRTIEGHTSLVKRKKIAEETLQFFVPMAELVGFSPMITEFKQRCTAILKSNT